MKKLFGTDGIRGTVNEYPMVPDIALKLGISLGQISPKPKIVIGKDTRLSGYIFEYSLSSGICAAGGEVLFVGVLPTPAIAYLTKKYNANAGIVISASHNPATDNGLKIFSSKGFKLPDEIELKIEHKMFSELNLSKDTGKAIKLKNAKREYIDFAKNTVNNIDLKELKIVLDCANGAGYYVAPTILKELGAEVITLNNSPNGNNINENSGALYPENIIKIIKENKANIGICLDGDADRIIALDEKGEIIDGDKIMYICAKYLAQKNKLKNKTLITTVMSNEGLIQSLKKEKIDVKRTSVGDRYVIEKIKELDCNFGGEQSGHIIFTDYTTTGDGIISGLLLLKIMKETSMKISELIEGLEIFPQKLINIKVKEKKDLMEMPKVLKKIENAEKEFKEKGRVLVRYSGTENKARVMVEGKNLKLVNKYVNEIANEIKKEIGI